MIIGTQPELFYPYASISEYLMHIFSNKHDSHAYLLEIAGIAHLLGLWPRQSTV